MSLRSQLCPGLAAFLWGLTHVALAGGGPPDPARLCLRGETVVFACQLASRPVALCGQGQPLARLAYRYGRPGRLEMQHVAAPDSFFRTTTPLYGGGETAVGFARRGWHYQLYSRNTRGPGATPAERVPIVEDGLIVSRPGQPAMPRVCSDGGAGFRVDVTAIPLR